MQHAKLVTMMLVCIFLATMLSTFENGYATFIVVLLAVTVGKLLGANEERKKNNSKLAEIAAESERRMESEGKAALQYLLLWEKSGLPWEELNPTLAREGLLYILYVLNDDPLNKLGVEGFETGLRLFKRLQALILRAPSTPELSEMLAQVKDLYVVSLPSAA